MIVSRWLLLALALARAQRRPSSSELLHGLLGENIAEKLDTSQSAQLDVPRTARAAAAGASSGVSARQLASALTLEELEERAEGDTQQAFLLAIRYYHGDGVPTDRARVGIRTPFVPVALSHVPRENLCSERANRAHGG